MNLKLGAQWYQYFIKYIGDCYHPSYITSKARVHSSQEGGIGKIPGFQYDVLTELVALCEGNAHYCNDRSSSGKGQHNWKTNELQLVEIVFMILQQGPTVTFSLVTIFPRMWFVNMLP